MSKSLDKPESINDQPESSGSEYSRLAGQISAINKYLDDMGIPKIKPANKRVKLASLMYQQAVLEINRLNVLLSIK